MQDIVKSRSTSSKGNTHDLVVNYEGHERRKKEERYSPRNS
jgi:hypothetical protein